MKYTDSFGEVLAKALGGKAADITGDLTRNNLWMHATERQLLGWERCRVDIHDLVRAYETYKSTSEWQTAYLDWVFLDAMMYVVIYMLIDDIYDDVLLPGDVPKFFPPVQRAFANSPDYEKAHPLWLDIKLTVEIAFFRWLPTLLLLALGIGCFYVGEGWPMMGWLILGLLAVWRIYRSVRWLARFGLRRRARKMINMLTDGYALLGARTVPMRELRQVVEKARDVFGRSAMFGGNFWVILDDVCARHPVSLIPSVSSS
jgi:hypothetical protein